MIPKKPFVARFRRGESREKKAEPSVRANATVCHGSCCCTLRASRRRGSPVTLGKNYEDQGPQFPACLQGPDNGGSYGHRLRAQGAKA